MKSAQSFLDDVKVIVNDINTNESSITKTQLIQYQKQLRIIKKEIVETKKVSNAQFEINKANSNPGCLASLLGKGHVRSVHASNKRSIQTQKLQAASMYDQVIRNIDRCMIEIDRIKLLK